MTMPIQGTEGNVHQPYMNMPAGKSTAARHALNSRASGPFVGWYFLQKRHGVK